MKLPNGDRAYLGDKLEAHSLNPFHREGRHKTRVFASALGVTLENGDLLRHAVLQAAEVAENVSDTGHNGYGRNFVLRFVIKTDTGEAEVLTAWIIRDGEDFPRLTTCYIL